jgi:hypothetical protein
MFSEYAKPTAESLAFRKAASNLGKMLRASLANRLIRHRGPRFSITSKKRKHNGMARHV